MHVSSQNLFANFRDNKKNHSHTDIDPEYKLMRSGVIQRLNVMIEKHQFADRVARLAAFEECKSRNRLQTQT
jgi:hypothetical protein